MQIDYAFLDENPAYLDGLEKVKYLNAVNDFAERYIHEISRKNNKLTKSFLGKKGLIHVSKENQRKTPIQFV